MSDVAREFNPDTLRVVMGPESQTHTVMGIERTPLNIEFSRVFSMAPSSVLGENEYSTEPESFNAIGSANRHGAHENDLHHLPVIDVDGGAIVTTAGRSGSKAILKTVAGGGQYTPDSQLRDVLGDNGIDLEVFDKVDYHPGGGWGGSVHTRVGAIVLRSKYPGTFVAIDSTQSGHSHLYIQRSFNSSDHRALVEELSGVGVVSERWLKMVKREGMSVVRTPWTEKDGDLADS